MFTDTSTLVFAITTLLTGLAITIILIGSFTYITTTLQFHLAIQRSQQAGTKTATNPPLFPYIVPGLGSTLSFSNQKIGAYWTWLASQASKYNQHAFSIVLAGTPTHLVFSPHGVAAAFKARELSRARLDQGLGVNVLGMSKEDSVRAFPYEEAAKERESTARIHSEHLLSSKAVNALTGRFMGCFQAELEGERGLGAEDGVEVDLYAWLWQRIFRASTTALCGSKLLEMFPDFDKDYRVWEDNMLAMLFGTPRLFAREAYAARDATVSKLEDWLEEGYKHPPKGDPDWEPNFGSRVIRKRHDFYAQQHLSPHAQAGFDLIFLAGILSNATPATGWMLLHILSPSAADFRAKIMAELRTAQRPDGSLDIPALTKLPLLNSTFHEILRLYVDLLVVRQVDSSVSLGAHHVQPGSQVMLPTWMTHRNADFFPRPDEFNPERFLTQDKDTGEMSYSATPSGLNGKYFPFGGGHYMCPGRTFAKQEVLGSVATLLLGFEVEFVGWVDGKGGKKEGGFPGMKDNYAGNQVVGIDGDMRVKIKRRRGVAGGVGA